MDKERFECWWCGEMVVKLPCDNCGNEKREAPRLDWERVKEVFGDYRIPSCGMTDAALLGGSDDNKPSSGTVYLGGGKNGNV